MENNKTFTKGVIAVVYGICLVFIITSLMSILYNIINFADAGIWNLYSGSNPISTKYWPKFLVQTIIPLILGISSLTFLIMSWFMKKRWVKLTAVILTAAAIVTLIIFIGIGSRFAITDAINYYGGSYKTITVNHLTISESVQALLLQMLVCFAPIFAYELVGLIKNIKEDRKTVTAALTEMNLMPAQTEITINESLIKEETEEKNNNTKKETTAKKPAVKTKIVKADTEVKTEIPPKKRTSKKTADKI